MLPGWTAVVFGLLPSDWAREGGQKAFPPKGLSRLSHRRRMEEDSVHSSYMARHTWRTRSLACSAGSACLVRHGGRPRCCEKTVKRSGTDGCGMQSFRDPEHLVAGVIVCLGIRCRCDSTRHDLLALPAADGAGCTQARRGQAMAVPSFYFRGLRRDASLRPSLGIPYAGPPW